MPSTGSRIVATGLRVGGGASGNLPAGTLTKLDSVIDIDTGAKKKPDPAIDVIQPLALQGGADAETLDAAERRIPAYFQHRDRAVTASDYRVLAREAPGVQVARVEVLPRFKPHVFQLVVVDDSGNNSDTASVTIIVQDTERPTAVVDFIDEAGNRNPAPEVVVPFGKGFRLSGERSSDIGGAVKVWNWTLLRG